MLTQLVKLKSKYMVEKYATMLITHFIFIVFNIFIYISH